MLALLSRIRGDFVTSVILICVEIFFLITRRLRVSRSIIIGLIVRGIFIRFLDDFRFPVRVFVFLFGNVFIAAPVYFFYRLILPLRGGVLFADTKKPVETTKTAAKIASTFFTLFVIKTPRFQVGTSIILVNCRNVKDLTEKIRGKIR